MNNNCEISDSDLMSSLSYFDALSPEAKQAITQRWIRIPRWHEGRILYDFGERPSRVYIVVSGIVEVRKEDYGITRCFGAGSVLGDEALIGGVPHKSRAIARTNCILIVMDDWFRILAERNPSVQRNVINQAQIRDAEQESYSCQMLRASKTGRVALALLNIAEAVSQQIVQDFHTAFPFAVEWWDTQTKIARLLNICRPIVRAALRMLDAADVIEAGSDTSDQIVLPPVLTKDSVEGLRRLLRTIL